MKLTQTDRQDIVVALQSGNATMTELAEAYNVTQSNISQIYKRVTGKPFKVRTYTIKPGPRRRRQINVLPTVFQRKLPVVHHQTLENPPLPDDFQRAKLCLTHGYAVIELTGKITEQEGEIIKRMIDFFATISHNEVQYP